MEHQHCQELRGAWLHRTFQLFSGGQLRLIQKCLKGFFEMKKILVQQECYLENLYFFLK